MQATTQYFVKRFFYKQVLDFHQPSKFISDIWASKSVVPIEDPVGLASFCRIRIRILGLPIRIRIYFYLMQS